MTKTEERHKARKLRKEKGLSVNKIAELLNVSRSTVSRWVTDIPLTADQRHQLIQNKASYGAQHQGSITNKEKHRKIREQYQQAGRLKAKEGDPLHLMGCMLYWAEGRKRRGECTFTNSDPDMMATFMKFLRECFQLDSTQVDLRITVYLDNELSIEEIESHWLKILQVPLTAIKQVKTQKPKSSQQKGRKLPYGTCELRVQSGTQYVQHIFGAIQEYTGINKPEWID